MHDGFDAAHPLNKVLDRCGGGEAPPFLAGPGGCGEISDPGRLERWKPGRVHGLACALVAPKDRQQVHVAAVNRWLEELPQGPHDVERCGSEALGLYALFHSSGTAWGIYLNIDAIGCVAREMPVPGPPHIRFGALLLKVLMHEWHHYLEEVALSHLELTSGQNLVLPYQRLYAKRWPSQVVNESLANAYALDRAASVLRRLPDGGHHIAALEDLMRASPGSYREFERYPWGTPCHWEGLLSWLADVLPHGFPSPESAALTVDAVRFRFGRIDHGGAAVRLAQQSPSHVPWRAFQELSVGR